MLHRLIIIIFCNFRSGIARFFDGNAARFHRTFRHKYSGAAAEQLCSPGNTLAVIAVCGRDKMDFGTLLSDFVFLEVTVIHSFVIQPQLFAEDTEHGITAAETFKSVKAETMRFVLAVYAFNSKGSGLFL